MTAAPVSVDPLSIGDDSASVIGTVRLVLAATTLVTVLTDPLVLQKLPSVAWIIFTGFTFHNVVLYLMAHARKAIAQSRLVTWLDLLWYTALVFVTGSDTSLFFLLYFFSILVSSFRHGFDEGARVTLASAILFSLTAHSTTGSTELLQVLLRSAFLLALGYMIARWGESNLVQKRRLGLLREVSRLSNPRFGVEHTIADVMQRVRAFFAADACAVVYRRLGSPRWTLRMLAGGDARAAELPEHDNGGVAGLLMSLPAGMPVLYTRPLFAWAGWGGACCYYDQARASWQECSGETACQLAELLDARSFISAPLAIQNSEGRAFMASTRAGYSRTDLMFLCQIAGQVVPVLENIHVLDRLASEAALRERRKISRDLHDSTVQPYIGLSHTLTALHRKATPDNPLFSDIAVLARMAAEVVTDLRHYVGGFTREDSLAEPLFFGALRHHVRQVRLIYDLDIRLDLPPTMAVGDRLSAAAVHLVSEGISNIRKHTLARVGAVKLRCDQAALTIAIENDCASEDAPDFYPKSITERTEALGGSVRITHRAPATTVVHIHIPV